MSEIITVSSSDEEDVQPPPRKKIKPMLVEEVSVISKSNGKNTSDIVVLSDDDTEGNINKMSVIQAHLKFPTDVNPIAISDQNGILKIDPQFKESIMVEDEENGEKDGITIDENSSGDSSGKENKSQNDIPKNNEFNEPTTTAEIATEDKLLENFLKVCEKSIVNSQYEHLKDKQFSILRKYYKKCGAKLNESSNFLKLMEENMIRAEKSPATAVISFNEIFQYVKEVVDTESIEVSEEHRIKLKKLEKAIKLLVMRIKQLENSELDFDDEEDSTYLQLDRYINRLNKVYAKYCELLKKNPYSGRITYEKLDFVDSEFNEINRAISKKYKNNEKFPSYYEMEEYIRKVVNDYNLNLSETKIKTESVRCFKKLGELLQNRRKKELYDAHYLYIRDSEDPANVDKSLDSTLRHNFNEGQVKIEKICEEFRIKEEHGEEAVLSEEDSDKSEEDSENEENSNN
ncbi:uncharacterized protein LOC108911089 [Anoplophora glabripennis]|uniref:uncharacterized protein LOC108911089 n=1 Tax=Anoplophora glabripennis TaxID=217634 RepID=UPI000873574B|nr:uncharacterized protein LOC108911089 [Anoplophora glabripennis]